MPKLSIIMTTNLGDGIFAEFDGMQIHFYDSSDGMGAFEWEDCENLDLADDIIDRYGYYRKSDWKSVN